MSEIDFNELAENLSMGCPLTYHGACVLTEYFLPAEMTPNPDNNILIAFFYHDADALLRQETISDHELREAHPKEHRKLVNVQAAYLENAKEEIKKDCVQRQRYLLLYALDLFIPREEKDEMIQTNFQGFLDDANLTREDGMNVLSLIEGAADAGDITEPDLEKTSKIQKQSKVSDQKQEDTITSRFINNQDLTGPVPSLPNKTHGYRF